MLCFKNLHLTQTTSPSLLNWKKRPCVQCLEKKTLHCFRGLVKLWFSQTRWQETKVRCCIKCSKWKWSLVMTTQHDDKDKKQLTVSHCEMQKNFWLTQQCNCSFFVAKNDCNKLHCSLTNAHKLDEVELFDLQKQIDLSCQQDGSHQTFTNSNLRRQTTTRRIVPIFEHSLKQCQNTNRLCVLVIIAVLHVLSCWMKDVKRFTECWSIQSDWKWQWFFTEDFETLPQLRKVSNWRIIWSKWLAKCWIDKTKA